MVNPPVAVVEVYKIISHHLSLRMAYCYSTNNKSKMCGAPLTISSNLHAIFHQGWWRRALAQLAMSGGSSGTQSRICSCETSECRSCPCCSRTMLSFQSSLSETSSSPSFVWCPHRFHDAVKDAGVLCHTATEYIWHCQWKYTIIDSPKSGRIKW